MKSYTYQPEMCLLLSGKPFQVKQNLITIQLSMGRLFSVCTVINLILYTFCSAVTHNKFIAN
jgi:hypothetical protein